MRAATVLFFLGVLLAVSTAQAQIVNIQPLLGGQGEDGFDLEATGSAELKTGNVDLFVGRAALLMWYFAGSHRVISSSSGELGLKDGAEYLNSTFTHLRYQFYATEWFAWETWVQGASNRFKRLGFRGLAGTGPRFELVRGEAFTMALGIHYMFEHETLRDDLDDPDEGLTETNHRSNSYLTFSWALAPYLSLRETVYFQPLLTDPTGDFRLSNEVQLTAKVNDHLGLGANFQVAYDHAPPADVESLDTALMATLTVGL
jgi:hypothetical protein